MFRSHTVSRIISLSACALIVGFSGVAAAQTVVDTCGQEVSGSATLNADLDCTGFEGYAVTLHGGTLTMNGHTITGGMIGIQCDRSCKIVGPGTVTQATFAGVNAFDVGLKMSQVDLVDNAGFGAQVWDTATISGPAVISGNGTAIRVGSKAKLKDLTITGNHTAVEAANNANIATIAALRCTVTGNTLGLYAQRDVKVSNSTVTDNEQSGIRAGWSGCDNKAGAILKRSTVTGNATSPTCLGGTCADVVTCEKRPRVKPGSTCGTSADAATGATWGVCTLD